MAMTVQQLIESLRQYDENDTVIMDVDSATCMQLEELHNDGYPLSAVAENMVIQQIKESERFSDGKRFVIVEIGW